MHKLSNGLVLPAVGIGTFELTKKISTQDAEKLLNDFLIKNVGISLIDTAPVYDTEELVGNALKRALRESVPRENILVETKVPNGMQGYEKTLQAFDESLKKLGLEYLDIYLIHWPIPRFHETDYPELNLSTWRAMERLYKEGKIRAIGVSNFLPRHLQNIISVAEIQPMINQLEIHFWYQQQETVKYCQKHNILVESWDPFQRGKLFESEDVKRLAEKYDITSDKLALAWLKQRGIMPVVKSSSLGRMLGNLQIPSIEFNREDLDFIFGLDDENGHEDFWNYKRQLNF